MNIDSDSKLSKIFMPHQIQWIQAEKAIHDQNKQVMALAEKSVRIGWTYADGFKNVRKRLWFKNRDYLFATKDYNSALEYIRQCYKFAEIFNLTSSIVRHGEEYLSVNQLDANGRPTALIEQVKIGVIKFDNGSRIIAFSSNPQAMAAYGGDVGLDEFAKHPNAKLLWETAQGRIALGHDLAVWSAHDGEDTLFNEFAQEARASLINRSSRSDEALISSPPLSQTLSDTSPQTSSETSSPFSLNPSTIPSFQSSSRITYHASPPSDSTIQSFNDSTIQRSPWNLYFRVTMPDAIRFGLVDVINRAHGTRLTPEQFLADCRARARHEEIFEQSYLCNPLGASANHIVEWSAIERCRYDYEIERLHLEADQILALFGEFNPASQATRKSKIEQFIHKSFPLLFGASPDGSSIKNQNPKIKKYRAGLDVANSGQGNLAVFYIDEVKGDDLWLRGLFSCRTEDWNFLHTVISKFMRDLKSVQAAGDSSGLGRQICWELNRQFGSRFATVNFGAKKHDLGFALMNQLATARKRFPQSDQDIAADFFALRKTYESTRWVFSEGRNTLNPNSHCDIAWAAALATHAHTQRPCQAGGLVVHENGWSGGKDYHPFEDKPVPEPNREYTLAEAARLGFLKRF